MYGHDEELRTMARVDVVTLGVISFGVVVILVELIFWTIAGQWLFDGRFLKFGGGLVLVTIVLNLLVSAVIFSD